jgi:hypothetical protein
LAQDKEYNANIEENLLDSRVEPFHYPHVREEVKTNVSNNNAPDLISLLTKNIDQMNTQFIQVQNQIMSCMNIVEINQYAPITQFSR